MRQSCSIARQFSESVVSGLQTYARRHFLFLALTEQPRLTGQKAWGLGFLGSVASFQKRLKGFQIVLKPVELKAYVGGRGFAL